VFFERLQLSFALTPLGTKLAAIRETGPTQLAQRFAVSSPFLFDNQIAKIDAWRDRAGRFDGGRLGYFRK
jgi:hypothetical protein